MRKFLLVILFLAAALLPAKAQFFTAGDDPGNLRWFSVETPYYQIIYPEGTDSLARTYGRLLEQFRVPIGRSLGLTPGQGLRRKMPVVLHTHYPYSNGSVGWAPTRFDLYTCPDPYNPNPTPWEIELVSHEPRHQAQLQWGYSRGFPRVLSWIVGEGWNPVSWQFFFDRPFGEGDAVVAETGLAYGTRARTADFLNYYRVSLDQGDYRNWYRWGYGSFKKYTPDQYALGYLTIAGNRFLQKDPMVMQKVLEKSRRIPVLISPYNFRVVARKQAGKTFKSQFKDVLDTLNALWRADADRRAPFQPMEQVTPAESFSTDYNSPQWIEGQLTALRSGYLHPAEWVRITPDGKVRRIRPFSSSTSDVYIEPLKKRMYWSETLPDGRWSLGGTSIIRYCDLVTGRDYDLTRDTRLFNPEASPDGTRIATAEYPVTGGTAVVVLDSENGDILQRFPAPDGMQVVELCWLDGFIYVSGICNEGAGIFRVSMEGQWETMLAPSFQTISNMEDGPDYVQWVSDRTSVNELYRYYPAQGKLLQITSTRYGGIDFVEHDGYLYFVSQTLSGKMIFRTPLEALQPKEVDFADICSYPMEDELTRQERSLGPGPDLTAAVPVSAPKPFRKLGQTRFHTWLPLYVNYDAIKSGTWDLSYETASLGLSAFFQNTLGTFSGMVGYSLHRDPDVYHHWRNSFHAQTSITAWYPVLEASVDVGDRNVRHYHPLLLEEDGMNNPYTVVNHLEGVPSVTGSLRAYLPLSYYKGGFLYGFTPQLQYSVSNDWFSLHPAQFLRPPGFEGFPSGLRVVSLGEAGKMPLQRLRASIRGYLMLAKAQSQPYPSWGIGAETGISFRPGLSQLFTPTVYAYAYGYTPGFFPSQGLHLTTTFQHQIRGGSALFPEMTANTLPRGFDSAASTAVAQTFPNQWKVTADYAIPFSLGDISMSWVGYVKNFTLTPHADFTSLGGGYNLWSVGADLTASLGWFLVLPLGTSVGVSFSYLSGNWYQNTGQGKPYSVSLILDFDLL